MKDFDFKKIEKAYELYHAELQNMAETYFKDEFRPWLHARKLCFMAGNGTFFVTTYRRGIHIDLDNIPAFSKIYDMIGKPMEGTNTCLAEYFPDYNYRDDQLSGNP